MQPTVVGLFVGLLLGLAGVLEGFDALIIVAVCGLLGFLAMKVVEGEIDLTEYLGGRNRREQ